jgi:hypothetical protein
VTTPPPDPFATPSGPPQQPPYGGTPAPGTPPSYEVPSYGAPPAYGPPPGYGPPPSQWGGPAYGPPATTDSKAIIALVCAIAAWVAIPVIPAIVALVLASQSRRDILASGGRLGGDGLVTAAKVIAWANLALAVLVVVGLLLLLVVFASVGVSTS